MSYVSNARRHSPRSAAESGSRSRLAGATTSRSRSRCGYDDYTVDTEANRLVKAALRRIERLRLRDSRLRRRTAEALASFDGVTDVNFDPRRLPAFTYTRLDERYRPVLELAALLVRNTSVELHPGAATTSSILFDMNDVFEDFVWAAIGDELRRILPTSYRWRQGKSIALDEDRQVRPEPDLSLWDGRTLRLRRRREVQGDRTRRSRRPLPASCLLLRDRTRRGPSPLRREDRRPERPPHCSRRPTAARGDRRPHGASRRSPEQVPTHRVGDRSDGASRALRRPRAACFHPTSARVLLDAMRCAG